MSVGWGPDFLLFLYCTTMWGPTLSHEAGINFSASAKGWDSILHPLHAYASIQVSMQNLAYTLRLETKLLLRRPDPKSDE